MTKSKFTISEIKFMDSIKKSCQSQMKLNYILASIVGAMAILESSWGSADYVPDTNNLFRTLIDKDDKQWVGRSYSLDNHIMYESQYDCNSNDTLIKVYDTIDQSIEDHVAMLVSKRRSDGGPFKYRNIIGVKDYKKCLQNLVRDGYLSDHLFDYKDPKYESIMISIIEKYKLFEWDKEIGLDNLDNVKFTVKSSAEDTVSLFSTTVLENAEFIAKKNRGYKVYNDNVLLSDPWLINDYDPMYRVRLDWNHQETQISATKILEDAKKEADSHTGYKVYDENGVVIYDPWNVTKDDTEYFGIKTVMISTPGHKEILNNTPIYRNADDINPFLFLTGEFYLYDGKNINGKTRIARTNNPKHINGKDPSVVIGFVDIG